MDRTVLKNKTVIGLAISPFPGYNEGLDLQHSKQPMRNVYTTMECRVSTF